MFDWGSNCLTTALSDGTLTFETAYKDIGRSGTFDNYRDFETSIQEQIPRKVVIFIDNSGADIVLGIIPFARYFLEKGSKVALAANTFPSVNDVTEQELHSIISTITDPIIKQGVNETKLQIFGSGSSSPFLDFRRIDQSLCAYINEPNDPCDLLVIEGMGRAIHTNLYAKFSCKTLKVATIKNKVVADALDSNLYDAICVFEKPFFGKK